MKELVPRVAGGHYISNTRAAPLERFFNSNTVFEDVRQMTKLRHTDAWRRA